MSTTTRQRPAGPLTVGTDIFTALTIEENGILRHHLVSGWYKVPAVHGSLTDLWWEVANLIDDLHDAHEVLLPPDVKVPEPAAVPDGVAEADPANPYGSYASPYTAGSAAEVAEGVDAAEDYEHEIAATMDELCPATHGPDLSERCVYIVGHTALHSDMRGHTWPQDTGSAAEVAQDVEPGLCMATTPTRHGHSKVACTLANGHEGDHVASGTGTPGVSWPEGGTADWDAADKPQAKDGAR